MSVDRDIYWANIFTSSFLSQVSAIMWTYLSFQGLRKLLETVIKKIVFVSDLHILGAMLSSFGDTNLWGEKEAKREKSYPNKCCDECWVVGVGQKEISQTLQTKISSSLQLSVRTGLELSGWVSVVSCKKKIF